MTAKEFVVTFTTSVRMTETEWVLRNPSMKITEETTICEIYKWFKKQTVAETMEIKIIELTKS